MIRNTRDIINEKRVAKKYIEAKNYLKTNGFSRSIKHLLEDIENSILK